MIQYIVTVQEINGCLAVDRKCVHASETQSEVHYANVLAASISRTMTDMAAELGKAPDGWAVESNLPDGWDHVIDKQIEDLRQGKIGPKSGNHN